MRRLPRLPWTRIVLVLAALLVGYLIFATVGDTLLSRRLNRDEDRLRHEIAELERQERELQAIRDYLHTDEYVEGVARRLLGLVRPGETLIILSSTVEPMPTAAEGASEQAERTWWEELYDP